jgi:mRNA interferase RelE/StbE
MTARYELGTAPPARRALAERLPIEVASAAAEFITGPLLEDPRRVGKPLGAELAGIYSAPVLAATGGCCMRSMTPSMW